VPEKEGAEVIPQEPQVPATPANEATDEPTNKPAQPATAHQSPLTPEHRSGAGPKSLFTFQYELLMAEVKFIQARIAAYDGIAFRIKGWAVTLWSAVVGFGVKEKTPLLVLASLPVLLVFWLLDAIFKGYQRRTTSRMGAIERFFDSRPPFEANGLREAFERQDFGNFPLHDPVASRTSRMNKEIGDRYAEGTSVWSCFWVINVCSFYLILALSALVLMVLLLLAAKPDPPFMPPAG
jgi:hypothetical protein